MRLCLDPKVAMTPRLKNRATLNSLETQITGILSAISNRIRRSYKRGTEIDLDKLGRDVEEEGNWIARENTRILYPPMS